MSPVPIQTDRLEAMMGFTTVDPEVRDAAHRESLAWGRSRTEREMEQIDEVFAKAAKEAQDGDDFDYGKVQCIEGDAEEVAGTIKAMHSKIAGYTQTLAGIDAIEHVATRRKTAAREDNTLTPLTGGVSRATLSSMLLGAPGSDEENTMLAKLAGRAKFEQQLDVDVRAATLGSGGADGTTDPQGWEPPEIRQRRVVDAQYVEPHLVQQVNQFRLPMEATAVRYMKMTTRTNAAAGVAEGAVFPESTMRWTEESEDIHTIGTKMPVTNFILRHAPSLRARIDMHLRSFVMEQLDRDFLTGPGTGTRQNGIVTQVGNGRRTNLTGGSTPNKVIGNVLSVRTALRRLGARPDFMWLSPEVFEAAISQESANFGYYLNAVQGGAQMTNVLWGLPVTADTPYFAESGAADVGIVGNRMFMEVWFGSGLLLAAGTSDDDFDRSQYRVRVEVDVATVCTRPEAFRLLYRTA